MKPPSVSLTVFASRPVWVCKPAAQAAVDRFGFSALAPVRPAIVPRRTARCPRTSARLLPLLRLLLRMPVAGGATTQDGDEGPPGAGAYCG